MATGFIAPVQLTNNAATVLKRLLQGDVEAPYLRIGVKGGGCSGMSFMLGFDARNEDDDLFDIDGIPVIIKKAHGMYLVGMEVDYQDNSGTSGFVFNKSL
ncbi:HesB/IscA family protein [Chitinophaga flava]|uniref:Iron-sulfur cluster assembly accessory protein n=1 Tax=Chitinophaga flava TaxID=2259036 RepID=A0A365XUC9_9BACT|nr:iron-sulfur cluster assembly accessory protein [Chitinophaga flava]RBL89195.1 iron-sulfur cluster assembly accessory protein [Chitinophaga flava]